MYICNLSLLATEEDLVNFFNPHLKHPIAVNSIRIVKDKRTFKSRGMALIQINPEDRDIVVKLQGVELMRRNIRLSLCD